ncbi:dethiobiotin synthase [bacterium]|nr:MAG: dethiobiotin synthase [bacterium]
MLKKYFITGTDTGVGKTHISAVLTLGLGATYWKPVQSGSLDETDTKLVQKLTGLPDSKFLNERYKLREPRSPHEAAEAEGIQISQSDFILPKIDDHLIVEGAGGVFVPINWHFQMIDLMQLFSLPVIIVTKTQLGTLNHTQLTVKALQARNIPIAGFIMTGEYDHENEKSLNKLLEIPYMGFVPFRDKWDESSLKEAFNQLKGIV